LEQRSVLKWETTRKIGKTKYVLWYGVIGIGLSIAILLTLIEWASEKRINPIWAFIRILLFPIIGSLIMNVRWTNQERRLNDHQQVLKK
jgi:formate-dependent nitrite reductase membrane component NrfD